MFFFAILIGFLLVLLFYVLSVYNSLAKMKVQIQEAWSGVDIQLKRRVDMIPNLVETVKGYAKHEQSVFENVTKARAALMSAKNPQDADKANNMLTDALKSLFAVAENYPDLKASENFRSLQGEIADTETKVAYSRQFYNAAVRDYNSKLVVFPNTLIANTFGFKSETFFEAAVAEREPVKVAF